MECAGSLLFANHLRLGLLSKSAKEGFRCTPAIPLWVLMMAAAGFLLTLTAHSGVESTDFSQETGGLTICAPGHHFLQSWAHRLNSKLSGMVDVIGARVAARAKPDILGAAVTEEGRLDNSSYTPDTPGAPLPCRDSSGASASIERPVRARLHDRRVSASFAEQVRARRRRRRSRRITSHGPKGVTGQLIGWENRLPETMVLGGVSGPTIAGDAVGPRNLARDAPSLLLEGCCFGWSRTLPLAAIGPPLANLESVGRGFVLTEKFATILARWGSGLVNALIVTVGVYGGALHEVPGCHLGSPASFSSLPPRRSSWADDVRQPSSALAGCDSSGDAFVFLGAGRDAATSPYRDFSRSRWADRWGRAEEASRKCSGSFGSFSVCCAVGLTYTARYDARPRAIVVPGGCGVRCKISVLGCEFDQRFVLRRRAF